MPQDEKNGVTEFDSGQGIDRGEMFPNLRRHYASIEEAERQRQVRERGFTGEFAAGFSRGIDTLQGTGYGGLALLGTGLGLDGLRDWGLENYEEQMAQAEKTPAFVPTVGDIGSPYEAVRWAAGALGEVAPSIVESLIVGAATAAAGAVAGTAVAPGPGTVAGGAGGALAGALGRQTVRRSLVRMIRRNIKGLVAKGVAKNAAEAAVKKEMARRILFLRAADLIDNQYAPTVAMAAVAGLHEGGGSYAGIYNQGEDAPLTATTVGILAGALETVFPAKVLSGNIGGIPPKTLPRSVSLSPGRLAKTKKYTAKLLMGAADGIILEGATEAAQEALQIAGEAVALDKDPFTEENFQRIINAAAMGAVGGGVFGGGAGLLQKRQKRPKKKIEPPQPDLDEGGTLTPDEPPPSPSATEAAPEAPSVAAPKTEGPRPTPEAPSVPDLYEQAEPISDAAPRFSEVKPYSKKTRPADYADRDTQAQQRFRSEIRPGTALIMSGKEDSAILIVLDAEPQRTKGRGQRPSWQVAVVPVDPNFRPKGKPRWESINNLRNQPNIRVLRNEQTQAGVADVEAPAPIAPVKPPAPAPAQPSSAPVEKAPVKKAPAPPPTAKPTAQAEGQVQSVFRLMAELNSVEGSIDKVKKSTKSGAKAREDKIDDILSRARELGAAAIPIIVRAESLRQKNREKLEETKGREPDEPRDRGLGEQPVRSDRPEREEVQPTTAEPGAGPAETGAVPTEGEGALPQETGAGEPTPAPVEPEPETAPEPEEDTGAARIWAKVNRAWDAGHTVYVATRVRATKIAPKHRDALRFRSGQIQIRSGRRWERVMSDALATLDLSASMALREPQDPMFRKWGVAEAAPEPEEAVPAEAPAEPEVREESEETKGLREILEGDLSANLSVLKERLDPLKEAEHPTFIRPEPILKKTSEAKSVKGKLQALYNYFVPKNDPRKVLKYLYVDDFNGEKVVVGTDGVKLVYAPYSGPHPIGTFLDKNIERSDLEGRTFPQWRRVLPAKEDMEYRIHINGEMLNLARGAARVRQVLRLLYGGEDNRALTSLRFPIDGGGYVYFNPEIFLSVVEGLIRAGYEPSRILLKSANSQALIETNNRVTHAIIVPLVPKKGVVPQPAMVDMSKFQFERIPKTQSQKESASPQKTKGKPKKKTAKKTTPEAKPKTPAVTASGAVLSVLNDVYSLFQQGIAVANKQLNEIREKRFGKLLGNSRLAFDAVEGAMNKHIENSGIVDFDQKEKTVERLLGATEMLPSQLAVRTDEQIELQQFSTPPAQAFIVVAVSGANSNTSVLEPSAGTGNLAVMARLAGATDVATNEISGDRREVLKMLGFEPTGINAEQIDNILPPNLSYDVIVMNPPFSATGGRTAHHDTAFGAEHVTQALRRLKPGGRLVAIVGQGMALGRPKMGSWWNSIYPYYNVRANIGFDGKYYRKYGTGFGNQIIVIDNTGPTDVRQIIMAENLSPDQALKKLLPLMEGQVDERVRARTTKESEAAPPDEGAGTAVTEGRDAIDRPAEVPDKPSGGLDEPRTVRRGRRKSGVESVSEPGAGEQGTGADIATGGPGGTVAGGETAGGGTVGAGPPRNLPLGVSEDFGKDNKIFTREEAEKALAALKEKLGRINAGVDPEVFQLGISLTGFYIEGGARSFAAYSKKMIETLGEGARPYLRSWYEGARHYPGFDSEGMTPSEEIVESQEPASGAEESVVSDEGEVYSAYKVSKPPIEGTVPHPAELVESATLASVEMPDPKGVIALPGELITSGKISDIQAEFIAAANQRFKQRGPDGRTRAIWNGDGTGVGKGVQIYGTIWNEQIQSNTKKAVHFSMSNDLIKDAVRDRDFIGAPMDIIPLQKFNNNEKIDAAEGVLFATYSTASSEWGGGKRRFNQIIEWLGADFDGVIAFDEAHAMKNASPENFGGRDTGTNAGKFGLELQNALPNAKIIYGSATGATTPRNMSFMMRLGIFGPGTPFSSFLAFLGAIHNGGVAGMEMLARDLKAVGAFVSRSIAYKGVKVNKIQHNLTDAEIQMYDRLAEFWAELAVAYNDSKKETKRGRDDFSQFYSTAQRFFLQVMVSFQISALKVNADRDLAEGRSVVINLFNTNEATAERQKAQSGGQLEEFDLTPRQMLVDLIERNFPVDQYENFFNPETGTRETRPVVDPETGEPVKNRKMLEKQQELLDRLADLSFPTNPIDEIVNHFGPDRIAEVSGRKNRVEGTRYVKRKISGVPQKKLNQHEASLFQDGEKRVILITSSGTTGISLHSSLSAKNQQQRSFYAMQLSWSADKQMQAFGRVHRSFQAIAPILNLLSVDAAGQKRLVNAISRRLAAMGAITRGDRETLGGEMFTSEDLTDEYGRDALPKVLSSLPFRTKLNLGIVDADGNIKSDSLQNVDRFLNRIMLLPIKEQNEVFERFYEAYKTEVQKAKDAGTFDSGVERIDARRIRMVAEPEVVHTDEGSGAQTKLLHLEGDFRTYRLSFEYISRLEPEEFIQNIRSKEVYAVLESGPSGRRIVGVRGAPRHIGELEYKHRFEKVGPAEAGNLWQSKYESIGAYQTESIYLLTGAIFPIYDKVAGRVGLRNMKVVRVETADGGSYIGLRPNKDEIGGIKRRLGIGAALAQQPPAEIFNMVMNEGAVVELDNGHRLRQATVQGERRLELDRRGDSGTMEFFREIGLIVEVIDYKRRAFIPDDDVLQRLFAKNKPIRDISQGGVEPMASAGRDVSETIASKLGLRYNGSTDAGKYILHFYTDVDLRMTFSLKDELNTLENVRELYNAKLMAFGKYPKASVSTFMIDGDAHLTFAQIRGVIDEFGLKGVDFRIVKSKAYLSEKQAEAHPNPNVKAGDRKAAEYHPRTRMITVYQGATVWDVVHELDHWIRYSDLLTPEERAAYDREYPSWEDSANALADYWERNIQPRTPLGRALRKIVDFLKTLMDRLGIRDLKARDVMERIANGSVANRQRNESLSLDEWMASIHEWNGNEQDEYINTHESANTNISQRTLASAQSSPLFGRRPGNAIRNVAEAFQEIAAQMGVENVEVVFKNEVGRVTKEEAANYPASSGVAEGSIKFSDYDPVSRTLTVYQGATVEDLIHEIAGHWSIRSGLLNENEVTAILNDRRFYDENGKFNEEIFAREIARFAIKNKEPSGAVERILHRIGELLRNILVGLRGIHAEDVFRRILSGEVGRRTGLPHYKMAMSQDRTMVNPFEIVTNGPRGTLAQAALETIGRTMAGRPTRQVEEAAEHLNEMIEKYVLKRKKPSDDLPEDGPPIESVNPNVEKKFQMNKGTTVVSRFEKFFQRVHRIFYRDWIKQAITTNPTLLDPERYGNLIDVIRLFDGMPMSARMVVRNILVDVAAGLGPKKADIFSKALILPDMLRTIEEYRAEAHERGDEIDPKKHLEMGYQSVQEIEKDLENVMWYVKNDEEIGRALKARQNFVKGVVYALVEQKILSPRILEDPRYYHRQVLAYRNAIIESEAYQKSSGVGFRIARRDKTGDYNTLYHEAEYEWLYQAIKLLKKKEFENEISHYDELHAIKERAKAENTRAFEEYVKQQKKENPQFVDPRDEFKKRIAINMQRLAAKIFSGKINAPGHYQGVLEDIQQAYDEWLEENYGQDSKDKTSLKMPDNPEMFSLLKYLLDHKLEGGIEAGGILSAIAQRNKMIRETLGDKFVTWQDITKYDEYADYDFYSFDEKTNIFPVWTIQESLMNSLLEADGKTLNVDQSAFRKMWASAGEQPQMFLPNEIIEQLNKMEKDYESRIKDPDPIDGLLKGATQNWKRWILLNPFNVLTYNINNFSGDADIVFAYYGARTIPHMKRAIIDLLALSRGKSNPTFVVKFNRLVELQVLNSGQIAQELTDVRDIEELAHLKSNDPNEFLRLFDNIFGAAYRGSKRATIFRENILRLAVYDMASEDIEAGKRTYGASNPVIINGITTNERKTARVARELVIDYGNISDTGKWLRTHLIPFYSWMEGNLPRYYRILRNTAREQSGVHGWMAARLATGAGARTAIKAATFALSAQALYAAITLWNRAMFPDDDDLLNRDRRQLQLIFFKSPDGQIHSLRFQGAFSDAMSWFGLEDYPKELGDLLYGRTDMAEIALEFPKAVIDRAVNGVNPAIKTPFELIAGRSTFPTIFEEGKTFAFRGRVIRDRAEHFTKTFALEWVYRQATGKNLRPGEWNPIWSAIAYRTDPGEASYFFVRQRASEWLRDQGKELPIIQPTQRQNALYYYKQALRFGENTKAERWLDRYFDLGGTRPGLRQSLTRSHPLGAIAKEERVKFVRSLSDRDKKVYKDAVEWYRDAY